MPQNELHTARTQGADLELANRGGVLLRAEAPAAEQKSEPQTAAREPRRAQPQ